MDHLRTEDHSMTDMPKGLVPMQHNGLKDPATCRLKVMTTQLEEATAMLPGSVVI